MYFGMIILTPLPHGSTLNIFPPSYDFDILDPKMLKYVFWNGNINPPPLPHGSTLNIFPPSYDFDILDPKMLKYVFWNDNINPPPPWIHIKHFDILDQ